MARRYAEVKKIKIDDNLRCLVMHTFDDLGSIAWLLDDIEASYVAKRLNLPLDVVKQIRKENDENPLSPHIMTPLVEKIYECVKEQLGENGLQRLIEYHNNKILDVPAKSFFAEEVTEFLEKKLGVKMLMTIPIPKSRRRE